MIGSESLDRSPSRVGMMRTILVVDDEPKIVQIARDYLERAGFRVMTAGDGRSVLPMVRHQKPDLIVLDLALPEMDGLDVARALRKESEIPVIMLTARADESDRLIGLELGADDYVVKPFSPRELVARVRAVLRRWDGARAGTDVVRAGDLTLDVPRMQASLGDRKLALTPTEFQLLAVMARQPGRIFTRGQLLEAVHGVAVESYERAIDSHIKNIRRKIEPDPRRPRYVLAVHGIGYKFAEE
jgi:two-component system alkaline phosphatase synthesis response regulator PhoP